MNKEIKKNVRIANKKASFQFNFFKKFVAGIMLNGTEVKAIRLSNVSINEAFCYLKKGELFIKNMNISEYTLGTYLNHKPNRERKLLLNKRELVIIENKVKERGWTIIPIELSFSETGFVKIEIALAQGKKLFDKRNSIKERDDKRSLARLKKNFN